jgi:hypothetical protein
LRGLLGLVGLILRAVGVVVCHTGPHSVQGEKGIPSCAVVGVVGAVELAETSSRSLVTRDLNVTPGHGEGRWEGYIQVICAPEEVICHGRCGLLSMVRNPGQCGRSKIFRLKFKGDRKGAVKLYARTNKYAAGITRHARRYSSMLTAHDCQGAI